MVRRNRLRFFSGCGGPRPRIAAMLLVLAVTFLPGCSRARTLDFQLLASADRIQVKDLTGPSDKEVKQIDDSAQIRFAVEFLERHRKGWREPFGGSPIPQLMLHFYNKGSRLGGFGIDSTKIIADPVVYGWWSLPIPSSERDELLNRLGLTLPRPR